MYDQPLTASVRGSTLFDLASTLTAGSLLTVLRA